MILVAVLLVGGCRPLPPPPQPVAVVAPPVAGVAPQPLVPGAVPVFGAPPQPLPGPLTVPPLAAVPAGPASPLPGILGGTSISPEFGLPAGPDVAATLPNPLRVPAVSDEIAWEQIADVVSDYFRISSEHPARRTGEVWTEGRLETAPVAGATILEPHRWDSVGSFNIWESTFQTIRRYATVTVTPEAGSYLVGIEVQKELEDLLRPEVATAGAATFRTDGSLPDREREAVIRTASSSVWIPLGRDVALEQQMLAQLQARLGAPPPVPAGVVR